MTQYTATAQQMVALMENHNTRTWTAEDLNEHVTHVALSWLTRYVGSNKFLHSLQYDLGLRGTLTARQTVALLTIMQARYNKVEPKPVYRLVQFYRPVEGNDGRVAVRVA